MGGDLAYFKENDPFELAAKNADQLRDRSYIRIVCHAENENWLATLGDAGLMWFSAGFRYLQSQKKEQAP